MNSPQLIIYQDKKRVLIPRFSLLILLGAIFYLIILINLYLIEITNPIIKMLSIIAILALVILQIILDYLKVSKESYILYEDAILFNSKKQIILPYKDVQMLNYSQNTGDKIFKTASIRLTNDFSIKNISGVNNTYFFLQKLIQNAKYPNYNNHQQTYYTPNESAQKNQQTQYYQQQILNQNTRH